MEPVPQMAGMGASLMGAFQMVEGRLSAYRRSFFDGTGMPMGATIALMGAGALFSYHLVLPRISHAGSPTPP